MPHVTLPETNIATPKKKQKNLPTIHFQVAFSLLVSGSRVVFSSEAESMGISMDFLGGNPWRFNQPPVQPSGAPSCSANASWRLVGA